MSSIDYGLLARRHLDPSELSSLTYDLFLSSLNDAERVRKVFEGVASGRKLWIVHEEYEYADGEIPLGDCHRMTMASSEIDAWLELFQHLSRETDLRSAKIGIDITGMMRPHIMVLPLVLKSLDIAEVDIIYSDPVAYVKGAATSFSTSRVDRVAQIPGLEGVHVSRYDDAEAMIIGAGYDTELIRQVAQSRPGAEHQYLMVGLPGLQSHMYQESRLQVLKASEAITKYSPSTFLYAPANDPFVAASVVAAKVEELRLEKPQLSVYLAAVGPKPQALGFAVYRLCDPLGSSVSVLFPYATRYARETSVGLSRVHVYGVELDWIDLSV